ncbi:MAG: hypothetical protein NDP13_06825 [Crenarchaeota archaeon]|nr:hypothetical protein [Thermoproteota archaeon]
MKMEQGKLALDLLIGLSIFLFTFIFIANFLPGVFADVRNEISLMHEAYRVGVTLAEMEGYCRYPDGNGTTDWHANEYCWGNSSYKFFPGLTKGQVDYLDIYKMSKLQDLVTANYDSIRSLLGLKDPDRNYEIHLSLESIYSTPQNRILIRYANYTPVFDAGKEIPTSGYVAKYERFVWLDPWFSLVNVIYIGSPVGQPSNYHSRDIGCNLTYPVTFIALMVEGKNKPETGAPWWLGLCLLTEDENPSSCQPKGGNEKKDSLEVGFGSPMRSTPTPRAYDLYPKTTYIITDAVNDILKEAGFNKGDAVNFMATSKNINVSVVCAPSLTFIAGKAVAKLVVYVW